MNDLKKIDKQRFKGQAGEKYVENLLHDVFTPLYCYSQPTDLTDKNQHEICDHLVCWQEALIIVSVKNWSFRGDHTQYLKNTVEKGIKQIQGAERKLIHFPRDIEIDHPYYGRHRFPREKYSRVFRLVVNLGEGEEFYPLVGKTKQEGFVSIVNKDTLEVMLSELDTPADLLHYLTERERLLMSTDKDGNRNFLLSGREADLLSLYLKNAREFPQEFYTKEYNTVTLDLEGAWEEFKQRPEVIARDNANYDSYIIDELIRRELIPLEGSEPIIKVLLSFNRLERRRIGESFVKAIRHYSTFAVAGNTFRRELPFQGINIVLLFYPIGFSVEVRAMCVQLALNGIAMRNNYSDSEILIIGTSQEAEQFHFAYDPNVLPMNAEEEAGIKSSLETLGWFTNMEKYEVITKEYPIGDPS